ncbi:MAG: tail fiber domain-containing protein [Marichromatium sp.]|nr:tail fiber domain-containing protein [Marichromatium sp.]
MTQITAFPIPTRVLDPSKYPEFKGADGRQVELRSNGTHVQWRYVGDVSWIDLVAIAALQGPKGDTGTAGADGTDGADARDIELQANETHLQWRYVGGTTWTDLVPLATITGPAGTNGTNGTDGTNGREVELRASATHIQWRYAGEALWQDLLALSVLKGDTGADGTPVELRVDGGFIQWRYVGGLWQSLLPTSALQGPQGAQGPKGDAGAAGADGREIEIRNDGTNIQWRYAGTSAWADLVALSALKGAAGDDGREVEIRDSGSYIQWRYAGGTWQNLVSHATLRSGMLQAPSAYPAQSSLSNTDKLLLQTSGGSLRHILGSALRAAVLSLGLTTGRVLVTGSDGKPAASGLRWDAVRGYLGIGQTPNHALSVKGNIFATEKIHATEAVVSSDPDGFRMVYGQYGVFWRNDGNDFYLMNTNAWDQWGTWNNTRPFVFNMASGTVYLGNGTLKLNPGGNSIVVHTPFYIQAAGYTGGTNADVWITTTGQLYRGSSDRRLKKDIEGLSYGLAEIRQLEPVRFRWRDREIMGDREDVGVIAQDVQAVMPELVGEDSSGMLNLSYSKLVPPLINAVKALAARVEALEAGQPC